MDRYEVLTNSHAHYDREYKKGEILETDLDMCSLFPNKFRRLEIPSKYLGGNKSNEPNQDVYNVTDQFPIAVESGLIVMQRKTRSDFFDVFEDANSEKPINEKALKKENIESFIKENWLEE